MVGVPGKYKGCETCRRRRVTCTNERPFCRKCISSGRDCEGYERERVFITGTPEGRGRVASHPKRVTPPKKQQQQQQQQQQQGGGGASSSAAAPPSTSKSSPQPGRRKRQSESQSPPLHPQQQQQQQQFTGHTTGGTLQSSAWDQQLDFFSSFEPSSAASDAGKHITALHTSLHTIVRSPPSPSIPHGRGRGFGIALPPYAPVELHAHHNHHQQQQQQPHHPDAAAAMYGPGTGSDAPLWVSAQCLLCHRGVQGGSQSADSYCVFLFEQSSPAVGWDIASHSVVRSLGPARFAEFPNHHFFVRVYRPIGVCLALLHRRETFLSEPEWTSLPWSRHPKSSLDALFDIMLRLPAVLAQTDGLVPQASTTERRCQAQGLLQNCLMLERQFTAWLSQTVAGRPEQRFVDQVIGDASSTTATTTTTTAQQQQQQVYTFHDELTALNLLYYWMSQMLFHRCIEVLCDVACQPVLDPFADMWTTLPPVDPERYRDRRGLAAKICRGLDSALNCTLQPDMLVAPMTVALDFYRDLQLTSQDGIFECMELELFRTRLIAKGQEVANMLQGRAWD